jgi:hypothetical protein
MRPLIVGDSIFNARAAILQLAAAGSAGWQPRNLKEG